MKWKITYHDKVDVGLPDWPPKIRAKYLYIIRLMEQNGPDLGPPLTDSMGGGLFEIRAKGQEGIGRAFFCTVIGKEIVILHEFIKKTQKTPAKEFEIARKRMKEVKQ